MSLHRQNSDTQINSPPFEGPEKLLEIWFARTAADVPDATSATDSKFGLRKISRSTWEDMLGVVKCKVLSVVEGTEMDAYLLSESSFFVSPHRLILKTCGTTLNLLGLPRILEIARDQASLHSVYRCFYSRKAFMFPERQLGPHRDWNEEVEFLDGFFPNGAAYTVGKVNGDHWLLYLTCPAEDDFALTFAETEMLSETQVTKTCSAHVGTLGESPLVLQDYTIEILMSDLSTECCQQFFSQTNPDADNGSITPSGHGQLLSSTLGISHIFPPQLTTLDAYAFSPCGYSANALIRWDDSAETDDDRPASGNGGEKQTTHSLKEGYYTIHVTPEQPSSYASFECNVPVPTTLRSFSSTSYSSPFRRRAGKNVPDLQTLVKRVVSIFQPGKLSLTLFLSSGVDNNGSAVGGDAEEDSSNDERSVEAAQKAFKAALAPVPVIGCADEQVNTKDFYYKRTDKINYEFGGYDLAFASYELIRR